MRTGSQVWQNALNASLAISVLVLRTQSTRKAAYSRYEILDHSIYGRHVDRCSCHHRAAVREEMGKAQSLRRVFSGAGGYLVFLLAGHALMDLNLGH